MIPVRRPSPRAFLVTAALSAASCGNTKMQDDLPSRDPGLPSAPAPTPSSDASACDVVRCSDDFRTIVRECDGVVLGTCSDDQGCGDGACIDPCNAATAAQGSLGCDFLTQLPLTYPIAVEGFFDGGCFAAYVNSVWPSPTDLAVEFQGRSLPLERAVFTVQSGTAQLLPHTGPLMPGESVILFLSDAGLEEQVADQTSLGDSPILCPDASRPLLVAASARRSERRSGRGDSFRVTSTRPVAISTIYPYGAALSRFTSATTLFPVPTWQNDQIVVNAWSSATNGTDILAYPTAQIVAASDDTVLTIRPKANVVNGADFQGVAAGDTLTYSLRRNEYLQLTQEAELSGSFVSANKPIAVFGGHECMYIDRATPACDASQQQLPALSQWGREYGAAPYRPRFAGEPMPYKLVGSADATNLTYDPPLPPPGAPVTVSKGEVVTFWTDQPFVVRAQDDEHGFFLSAHMSGVDNDPHQLGDPEFVGVVPADQYLSRYTMFADSTYSETTLTIVRRTTKAGFRDVNLRCLGVVTSFRPLGNAGLFEYAQVDLTRRTAPVTNPTGLCGYGRHDLSSDGPFTATLWGWDYRASYAIAGGTSLRKLTRRDFNELR